MGPIGSIPLPLFDAMSLPTVVTLPYDITFTIIRNPK